MAEAQRYSKITRATRETEIALELALEPGDIHVSTGLPFLDHLLSSFAFYGGIAVSLTCTGDLDVDDHHSAEDCAIALGGGIRQALGEGKGIRRFGHAFAPLDESLARAVVDLSGRPFCAVSLGLKRERLGALSCECVPHFVSSMAGAAMACVHLDVLRGRNDHHRAEAAFKALGLAFREAAYPTADRDRVPSLKGAVRAGGSS